MNLEARLSVEESPSEKLPESRGINALNVFLKKERF